MTRGRSLAAVAGVFLLGVLAGVLGTHLYFAHSLERQGWRPRHPHHENFLERLKHQLELDDEQTARIEEILRRSHEAAEEIRQEMAPRVHRHMLATHDEIVAILSEDQRTRFESLMEGMENRAERYFLGPPGGRGPRNRHRPGRHGQRRKPAGPPPPPPD